MFSITIDQEIKLALVEPSFACQYAKLVADDIEYLSEWLQWPPHCQTEEDFRGFVSRSLHDYADGKSITCAMMYCDEVVGNISFNSIRKDVKSVEIGYWIASKYQGKGIVSRSVSALIDMAFQQLAMEKVQISAAEGNKASRAVCERLGLRLEGTITNAENLHGRIVDHTIYAMHKKNWLEHKR